MKDVDDTCAGDCRRRMGPPGLPGSALENHITTARRPHTLWEAKPVLIVCCGALVSFRFVGDYTAAAGTFFGGSFKAGRSRIKNGYSCTGTAGPRSSQGIPIRQIDCFLSSPPLIHVFHLSSNEPAAVWHRSGHLCISPCTVHG